ncbi:MAG: alpha/beta fold hydrolase, partial [Chthonomonadales bacterium]
MDQPEPERARKRLSRRAKRRIVIYLSLVFAFYIYMCFFLAWNTVKPKNFKHTSNPMQKMGIVFQDVSFVSKDSTPIKGWLIPAPEKTASGVVILCHGVDGNRQSMMHEVSILNKANFTTIAFDFRGRGESGNALCTIGYREVEDLLAVVNFAKSWPETRDLPLGVFGHSLGGAVAIMATARDSRIEAVAAESPFASLDHAINNHFQSVMGWGAVFFALPVRVIGEMIIHQSASNIAPINEIAKIAPRPVMLIEDELDTLCPPAETEALLRAAGDPKSMWHVPGAGHIQAGDVASAEFEKMWELRQSNYLRHSPFFPKHTDYKQCPACRDCALLSS